MLMKLFAESFRNLMPALKKSWLWLIGLMLICEGLAEFSNQYGQWLFADLPDFEVIRLVYMALTQLLIAVAEAFSSVLIVSLAIHATQTNDSRGMGAILKQNTRLHGRDFTVEMLRTTIHVLLWSLLLIIPGIFKQIRLNFVPFVVLFDPRYHRGEIDALEESNLRVRGITWIIFLALALTFVPDYILERAREGATAFSRPWPLLLTSLISSLIYAWSSAFGYTAYQFRMKENQ